MKLRASWSVFERWASGDHDDALRMSMGLPMRMMNENIRLAIEFGKETHELIASKKLDPLGFIPKNAIYEKVEPDKKKYINYYKVELSEWLIFSMIADVLYQLPNGTWAVVDWKTGRLNSTEQKKMQVYIYAYILSQLPEPITVSLGIIAKIEKDGQGLIYCPDYSMYKINEDKLMLAENYIDTVATEMYQELLNYKKRRNERP